MTTFSGLPRAQRGAIIGLDPLNPLASVIVFQYNPDTLTRTLTAQAASGGDKGEALRLKGPPQESIKLDVEIDALDQLGIGTGSTANMGLYPQLNSLELLIYPKAAVMIANDALAAAGMIEIIPPEAPLTLFVWGAKRILPVRIGSFSITEEAFDASLNPIRAKVSLELRVLNYQDLGMLSAGGSLFMAHQVTKEVMATINGIGNVAALASLPITFR